MKKNRTIKINRFKFVKCENRLNVVKCENRRNVVKCENRLNVVLCEKNRKMKFNQNEYNLIIFIPTLFMPFRSKMRIFSK